MLNCDGQLTRQCVNDISGFEPTRCSTLAIYANHMPPTTGAARLPSPSFQVKAEDLPEIEADWLSAQPMS